MDIRKMPDDEIICCLIEYDFNSKKWYWWNETWTKEYGPYDTRREAEEACKQKRK